MAGRGQDQRAKKRGRKETLQGYLTYKKTHPGRAGAGPEGRKERAREQEERYQEKPRVP